MQSVPFYLGSSPDKCSYQIRNNPMVSRVHACILCEKGKYYLMDLKSSNGTAVEDRPLKSGGRIKLKDETRFSLADELFIFRM